MLRGICLKQAVILLAALVLCSCSFSSSGADQAGASGEDGCAALTNLLALPGSGAEMTVPDPTTATGLGPVSWVSKKMEDVLANSRRDIFNQISGDGGFRAMMKGLVVLTIIFYAGAVVLGITNAHPYAVTMLLIKILLVTTLALNWNQFDGLVVQTFEGLVAGMSQTMANVFTDSQTPDNFYQTVDRMMTMFFSASFMRVILATFVSGWSGMFYGLLLLAMIFAYIAGIMNALKTYIMAMIARSLLYAIAPLFIMFALFNQTRSLFDGWLEQIINFSLQPIFIFAVVGMFHLLIVGLVATMVLPGHNNANVCWRPFWKLAGFIPIIYSNQYGDRTAADPGSSGAEAEIPLDIWIIFMVIIVSYLIHGSAKWAGDLAGQLSGGLVSASGIQLQGWEAIKQQALRPVAAATGATKAFFFGQPTGVGRGRDGGIFSIFNSQGHLQVPGVGLFKDDQGWSPLAAFRNMGKSIREGASNAWDNQSREARERASGMMGHGRGSKRRHNV